MIPSLLLLCAILFPSNLFPSFSFYAPCTPKNPGKICSLFFGSGECIRDDTSQASLPISNLTFCKQAFLRSRRASCSGCICCLGKAGIAADFAKWLKTELSTAPTTGTDMQLPVTRKHSWAWGRKICRKMLQFSLWRWNATISPIFFGE